MIYRPTAAAVVYRVNAHRVPVFLAVQKSRWDKDEWGVVQGEFHKHTDLTLENAVKRELREELGTTRFGHVVATGIRTQRLFSEKTLSRYGNGQYVGKDIVYFGVEFHGKQDDIALGSELSTYRWFGGRNFIKRVKYAQEMRGIIAMIKEDYTPKVVVSPIARTEYHSSSRKFYIHTS